MGMLAQTRLKCAEMILHARLNVELTDHQTSPEAQWVGPARPVRAPGEV